MSASITSQKCDSCGGSVDYDKQRKLWICRYCGNEMVRRENYDGQFSIKWVARQALLSTAAREMEAAEANLVECSKIDPHYVGTTIAYLAYAIVALSMTSNPDRRRRLSAQVNDYYAQLKRSALTPGSDEEAFYESLGSSDVYGMLALVYDTLADEAREKFVADCVDARGVYSASAAKDIVGYALAEGRFSLVDDLLQSNAELDSEFAFAQLLQGYPDNENKPANVQQVVSRLQSNEAAAEKLDAYLAATSDSFSTKFEIAKACSSAGIKPSIAPCLSALLPFCEQDDKAKAVFEFACGAKLSDEDVAAVVGYCARTACSRFGCIGLQALKATGQFVTIGQADVLALLERDDLETAEKRALLDAVYGFEIPERFRQAVLSCFLRLEAPKPDRVEMLRYLMGTVHELNPSLLDDYLLHYDKDAERKPQVVAILLEKWANSTRAVRTLSHYMTASPDPRPVTEGVVVAFASKGVMPGAADVCSYATKQEGTNAVEAVRAFKAGGWDGGTSALDAYLSTVTKDRKFSPELFSELYVPGSVVSAESLSAYVLHCIDPAMDKARKVKALAAASGLTAGTVRCRLTHANKTISCSLLQAYLLASPDPETVSREVIKELSQGVGDINSLISVGEGSGSSSMKFKKYVSMKKDVLASAARDFCESQRLFGWIF